MRRGAPRTASPPPLGARAAPGPGVRGLALAYGARIARDAARRRDTAALARLDRLDPNGSLRAQWERGGTGAPWTTRRFCPRTARRRRGATAPAPASGRSESAVAFADDGRDRGRDPHATRKHAGSVSSVFAFRAARRRRGRDGVRGDDEKNDTGAFAHESLFVRSTNGQGERDPRAALGPRARDRGPAARGLERGAEDSTRDARRATPILPPRRRRFRTRRLGVVPGFRAVSLLRFSRQSPWRARAGIRAEK